LCIANRLAGERWDAVYSSCLKRAAETADLIASKCGVEKVVRDRRLREKHFGLLEGTTQEERLMRWGEHPDLAELGVESAESIYGRAHRFLEDLSGRYDHHRIVVVTHGGWIRELFMR